MVDPEPDPDRDPDTDTVGQDQDPHQSTSTDSPQDAAGQPIVISVDPTTIADPTKRHGDPDGPDDDADDPDRTPLSIGDRNPYPDQVDGTGPIQPMAQPADDPDPNPNAIPTIADDWASATDPNTDPDTASPVIVRAGISANAAMTAAGTIERSLQEDIDAVLFPLFVAGDDISLARDALSDARDHEQTDGPSAVPVIRYAEAPIHLEWWLSDREAAAFIDGLDYLEDMETDHDAFLMEFLIGPGVADDVATDLMDAVRQLRRQSGVDTPSAGGS